MGSARSGRAGLQAQNSLAIASKWQDMPLFDIEPSKISPPISEGCKARFLDLAIGLGGRFEVIGTEVGFLEASVARNTVTDK
jgi:hypothetical protein